MRSGSTRWRAPSSRATPAISIVGRSRALDARAHLVEAIGEVFDLRLAGRVADQRRALGQRRRHHRVMRAADRDLGKFDLGAAAAPWAPWRRRSRPRSSISAPSFSSAISSRSTGRVPIAQPPGSETARFAHAREQRRDHPEARPHARDEIIGRGRVDDRLGAQMRGLAGGRLFAEPLAVDRIVDAVVAEDAHELADVGEARQVFQRQRLVGQQRGDHQRQRGVLGAGNRDHALELGAAADLNAIHAWFLLAGARRARLHRLRLVARLLRLRRRIRRSPAARAAAPCGASDSRAARRPGVRAVAAVRRPASVPPCRLCPPTARLIGRRTESRASQNPPRRR